MHLTQRATVHGEVLGKCKHFSAVDGPVSGDNAVAGNDVLVHVKVSAAVFNKRINLLKTTIVKKEFKALTSRHFSTVVLSINAGLTTASLAASLPIAQVLESLVGARHQLPRCFDTLRRPYCLLFGETDERVSASPQTRPVSRIHRW